MEVVIIFWLIPGVGVNQRLQVGTMPTSFMTTIAVYYRVSMPKVFFGTNGKDTNWRGWHLADFCMNWVLAEHLNKQF